MNENSNSLAIVEEFTLAEKERFLMKMWNLLQEQAGKFNGIDSTSMPVEKAEELLSSSIYTISLQAKEMGISGKELLESDFRQLLHEGQELLEAKKKSAFFNWNRICMQAPQVPNDYYMDTMKNLGYFFQRYDIYYGAHLIPCSIDYPLLNPISEEIKGISYVEEYLESMAMENSFINAFHPHQILALLEEITPAYKDIFMNLCQPVLVRALAKSLLGEDPYYLSISKENLEELEDGFFLKNRNQILQILRKAMEDLCRIISLDTKLVFYFASELRSMAIRMEIARDSGNLSHIFKKVI